ncbi:uncharacterized protein LOC123453154 [Hordeum vulgare subsp. vulgare]|uniref:uncharacterized protein LOC123453154 n=1 Tax=Hordeum vulgare subsp. vulgare TaxID=112509 RepID=UPI001D1A5061|nr:uncharacterized protein LOC123453154 [Hordeum vulgare subsp. vulgare]
MAAAEWWCWPLPTWLGSGTAWFVVLNLVVGAIFALSSRAQPQPQSQPPCRGGSGSRITRRASSAVLQNLSKKNIFSFPSSCFHHIAEPSPSPCAKHVTFKKTEDAGTPRPLQPQSTVEEGDMEDHNSMSMDEAYALALAGQQRALPTEGEAARSEVDAKAEEFIQGFKEDLTQQRLKSIFNYTQMLKLRVAAGRPAAAP